MGRAPCCDDKEGLRKGAWTAEEDEKLVSFIKRNKGHGSWRTLPKLAGLERCGKSCRLRWTNYLRPNIKRGSFSEEEEHIIIQLHAFLGNKWSSIASHLVGRTDNEVKNHWNTHLKKKLTRMGIDPTTHLPLQFIVQQTQDATSYYNLARDWYLLNYCNMDEWKNSMLQSSLQQLDPGIAYHIVPWELAKLEAEAPIDQITTPNISFTKDKMQAYVHESEQVQDLTYTFEEYMKVFYQQQQEPNLQKMPKLCSPFSIDFEPSTQVCESYDGGIVEVTAEEHKQTPSLEKKESNSSISSSNGSMATLETRHSNSNISNHLATGLDNEIEHDLTNLTNEMPIYPPLVHGFLQQPRTHDANLLQSDSYWKKIFNFINTSNLDYNVM